MRPAGPRNKSKRQCNSWDVFGPPSLDFDCIYFSEQWAHVTVLLGCAIMRAFFVGGTDFSNRSFSFAASCFFASGRRKKKKKKKKMMDLLQRVDKIEILPQFSGKIASPG